MTVDWAAVPSNLIFIGSRSPTQDRQIPMDCPLSELLPIGSVDETCSPPSEATAMLWEWRSEAESRNDRQCNSQCPIAPVTQNNVGEDPCGHATNATASCAFFTAHLASLCN